MGIFIEDLLNLGNLMDAEIEAHIPEATLSQALGLETKIEKGLITFRIKKKGLIFSKTLELKLSEESRMVKNLKEEGKRFVMGRMLTRSAVEELSKREDFLFEGEFAGFDVWKAFKLTETYEKVPYQFRERLALTRYIFSDYLLKIFMKVEK
ncbi:hypothetical protein [Thermocrinis minervae]|uniref:Uncharacterized protein n=1 Tax=Thermocrinis minervae TaxID=381751 RepID=A0A1M6SQ43_9AQUI|nr:hypothetical protein [Thermocrinis minervae]SHK46843.1 hypothetical protein SAMN05444391_1120 [Thermocrinis minervae]